MTKPIVGLDFGACNIKAIYIKNGRQRNIKLNKNQSSGAGIPNIIYYDAKQESGEQDIKVGEPAAMKTDEKNKVTYIKRKLEEKEWKTYIENLGKEVTAQEVVEGIFNWLQKRIAETLSTDDFDTVITVPVCFSEVQRHIISQAADKAGLHIKAVITESFAAIFSQEDLCDEDDEQHILVFDFGGSTLDLSLFHIEKDEDEVEITEEASAGLHYGGIDIDRDIYEQLFKQKYAEEVKEIIASDPRDQQIAEMELLNVVKRIKEDIFADEDEEEVEYNFGAKNHEVYEFILTKEEVIAVFDKINLKAKLVTAMDALLEGADEFDKEELTKVKVFGGSSSIDYVRNILVDYFGEDIFEDDDWEIDEIYMAIAGGAARYAYLRDEDDEYEYTISNCIPFSIGLNRAGEFVKYINRNENYGFETLLSYITIADLQADDYKVDVYQCFKDVDAVDINDEDIIYMGCVQLNKDLYTAKDAINFKMKMSKDGSLKFSFFEQVEVDGEKEMVLRESLAVLIGG